MLYVRLCQLDSSVLATADTRFTTSCLVEFVEIIDQGGMHGIMVTLSTAF